MACPFQGLQRGIGSSRWLPSDEHNREQAVLGISDKKPYRNWSAEENYLQEPLIQDVRVDDQALACFDRLRFLELSGIGIAFLLGVDSGRPM